MGGCSPVAAIVSSGASAVLLSRVSVNGEKAAFVTFHRSREPNALQIEVETIDFKPALADGALERTIQVTPHAIKRKEVHGRRRADRPELAGLRPSENGAISVLLVTS